MFYADGQTHDEVNSRFSRFSKELNKWKITLSFWDNKCHARHIATPLKRNFYIINTRRHDADDLIRAPRPSDNLAFFITDALSSLSTALGRHLLTCVSSRPFSAFSSHLNLGLPVLLLTSDLHSNIFLTVLRWSILTTCPVHSNHFLSLSPTTSRNYTASSILNLHIPSSTTGPYIHPNIFLPHVPIFSYPSQSSTTFHSHTPQLVSLPFLYLNFNFFTNGSRLKYLS